MNHPTYTFVKNTIAAIASEHSKKDLIQQNNARNKNAYVMGSDAYELNHLLSKSSDLAKISVRKTARNPRLNLICGYTDPETTEESR